MIEYPSISQSSKAPRQSCIAFEKYDGSNIRVKYTAKKGFCLFGSRTQLIDKSHPHLGEVIDIFNNKFADTLSCLIRKYFPNEREAIVFGEFFGPQSFAGMHVPGDTKEFVPFDLLIGNKNRKFLLPHEFIKLFSPVVKIPRIIYEGNLADNFIDDVRSGVYDVVEGVVCKGTHPSGAYRGNVWMAKIKTQKYLDRLFTKFGEDGIKKYGE